MVKMKMMTRNDVDKDNYDDGGNGHGDDGGGNADCDDDCGILCNLIDSLILPSMSALSVYNLILTCLIFSF